MKRSLISAAMIAAGLLFAAPLLLMAIASFKSEAEVLKPTQLLPTEWKLDNYQAVLENSIEAPVLTWFVNSVFVSSATTLLVIAVSSLAAFSFSRLRPSGSGPVLNLVVGAMMVPGQLFLIPVYVLLSRFALIDTPWALILPAAAGGFGVFMLTQFMRSMPVAIEEAALIDGCSLMQMFWRVTLPLSSPAVATLAIFTFIGSWNDYITPMVYMESVRNYTLPVGIALFQSSYSTQYGLTIATSLLSTLPLLILFLIFQKQIIESMTASGLKD